MRSFTIKSYAKINLALHVTGKKTKLHKIESLISFIELHDLINLKKINKNDHIVTFKGKFSKNISNVNTVTNLLKLLDETNLLNNQKFEIKILKSIPQQAGMGGGSMNAASLINFFINKKIIRIKENKLKKLIDQIGSDVILGIKPKNIILSHNGDITKYNKNVRLYTLVVKPSFGCSTKYIYSRVKIFSKPKFNFPQAKMFDAKYLKTLNNDLENIAFKKYPRLKKIKKFLSDMPNNIFTRMSGSGSSIVAYFDNKKACSNAYSQFRRKFSGHWCIKSKTI